MAYVLVGDFKYGMDRRRPRVAGTPGTLWNGVNVHISRGGDIERAKKFVSTFTIPASTFGLGQINGQIYVFGSADLAASMPSGVQYQRLQNAASAAMTRVLHNNTFDGKHYVIAEYADGNIDHFYNGSRVTAWDAIAAANSTYTTLADYMARKINANAAVSAISSGGIIIVTASIPGTAFTIGSATVDGGGNADQTAVVATPTANVAAVAEVRASGTITITGGTRDPNVNFISQVTANAVNLLSVPVDWVTSNTATATALAAGINNNTSTHGYSASSIGAVVTIRAAVGLGVTPNGYAVAKTVAGDVTASTANLAGGVTVVAAVAQVSTVTFGGTYQAADKFTVTVNGTGYVATGRASGHGTYVFVYKTREYITANSLYEWCKINDPTDWSTSGDSGYGFLNIANDSEGSDRLQCSVQYDQSVAIFSRKSIRVYRLEAVASDNQFVQSLENTGTIAARSVVSYGNTDVFYLDETGIRSLQVRQITDSSYVKDAGSAIDPLIADWFASVDEDTISRAVAVVEPIDGRYMIAIGSRIFVLSFFPSSKVNAWTYYEPGFIVTDFARINRRLYARDTGTIYLLGGPNNTTYPNAGELTATVELPFAAAGTPATFKQWEGFDIALEGEWTIDLLADPNDETKLISVGVIDNITYGLPQLATVGEAPLFALKATMTAAGAGKISSCVFHYEETEKG